MTMKENIDLKLIRKAATDNDGVMHAIVNGDIKLEDLFEDDELSEAREHFRFFYDLENQLMNIIDGEDEEDEDDDEDDNEDRIINEDDKDDSSYGFIDPYKYNPYSNGVCADLEDIYSDADLGSGFD